MVDHLSGLAGLIRVIPDYPTPGVVFRDLTPLFRDGPAFAKAVDALCERLVDLRVDRVIGIEARGFVLAAPVAYRLGVGFVPVRKAGKLPWAVAREEYQLEYGTDRLEIHRDALLPGEQVVVVDDVIATGGTAEATCRLVEGLGAEVASLVFVLEIGGLGGRQRLGSRRSESLLVV
jgi:adenine phosphoribosyltransferase